MDYPNFKLLVSSRNLPWFYVETEDHYNFSSYEGPLVFYCLIFKPSCSLLGVDLALNGQYTQDFEENFKASAINIS